MYTDWTAIALLLFTAVPLLNVVATATYYVIQNHQKTPLGRGSSQGPGRTAEFGKTWGVDGLVIQRCQLQR